MRLAVIGAADDHRCEANFGRALAVDNGFSTHFNHPAFVPSS
jgi:hypothetical protein